MRGVSGVSDFCQPCAATRNSLCWWPTGGAGASNGGAGNSGVLQLGHRPRLASIASLDLVLLLH